MQTFIFTGQPNSGKTRVLFELSHWLVRDKGYVVIDKQRFPDKYFAKGIENDVSVLLGKEGRKVLVVSATDDENCIDTLKNMIEKSDLRENDILLTSCRRYDDSDNLRQKFSEKLGFDIRKVWNRYSGSEIPGGNITDTNGNVIMEIPLVKLRYEQTDELTEWYNMRVVELSKWILENPTFCI